MLLRRIIFRSLLVCLCVLLSILGGAHNIASDSVMFIGTCCQMWKNKEASEQGEQPVLACSMRLYGEPGGKRTNVSFACGRDPLEVVPGVTTYMLYERIGYIFTAAREGREGD